MINGYKIAGTVRIAASEKEELNSNILRLLYLFGIRKLKDMKLDGQKLTVAARPAPDEKNIVWFDYSVFEKKRRTPSCYHMDTCILEVSDRGNEEYGLAMNAVMVLLENYSMSPCYLVNNGKLVPVENYGIRIRDTMGLLLEFRHRKSRFRTLEFFHTRGREECITESDVDDAYPRGFCDESIADMAAMMYTDVDDLKEMENSSKRFNGPKSAIREARDSLLRYYACQEMKNLMENGEKDVLTLFLKTLLDSDLQKRKAMAQSEDVYGVLAEISLYDLPAILVSAFAYVAGQTFWQTWEELGIRGYEDIIGDKICRTDCHERYQLPLYRAYQRENEDEFLEYWGEEDRKLSTDMVNMLEYWKARYETVCIPQDFAMEHTLAAVVRDLENDWDCRYVDQTLVTEYMKHKDEKEYQRAVLLLREFMDEDFRYFPELTHEQASQWIIQERRSHFDSIARSALASLLVNRRHRMDLFGF